MAGTVPTYTHAFYERQIDAAARSAEVVLPLLLELVDPSSVVDVGCGIGTWAAEAGRHSSVVDVVGVDGGEVPPGLLRIPPSAFLVRDLAEPLRLDRRFDMAISLEVAEHLPASRAAGFVADLVALAPVVLFSAAIPQQGGVGHVNEQWPDYWATLFDAHGYRRLDLIRTALWDDQRVSWWYRQNAFVYATADQLDHIDGDTGWPLRLVHPELFTKRAALPPSPPTIVGAARTLAGAVRRSVKRALG